MSNFVPEASEQLYISQVLSCIHNNDRSGLERILSTHGFHDFVSLEGLQPAHYAAYCQFPDILQVLVEAGAAVNDYSSMSTSVLQFAIQCYPDNQDVSCRMVEVLLAPVVDKSEVSFAKNVETNDEDGRYMTRINNRDILGEALQVAAGEGYSMLVPLLLNAGADPNYFSPCDEFYMTPVIGMIFENTCLPTHVSILEMLIEAGLDLKHVSNNWTALEYAQHYNRRDLIPLLQGIENCN